MTEYDEDVLRHLKRGSREAVRELIAPYRDNIGDDEVTIVMEELAEAWSLALN